MLQGDIAPITEADDRVIAEGEDGYLNGTGVYPRGTIREL
jgi:hypothetical protein